MSYDRDRAATFVLALMYLDLHEKSRAWKSYPWDVLDHLFEQGLITDPKRKAKSVDLSEQGLQMARDAFETLLGAETVSRTPRSVSTFGTAGLPDVLRAQIEMLLTPICRPHPDPSVSSKVRIGYRIEGTAVILFESRPSFMKPSEWREEPVAKFKFNKTRGFWQLYCMMRDLKWRSYQPLPNAHDVADLVTEVRADPTGIFWG